MSSTAKMVLLVILKILVVPLYFTIMCITFTIAIVGSIFSSLVSIISGLAGLALMAGFIMGTISGIGEVITCVIAIGICGVLTMAPEFITTTLARFEAYLSGILHTPLKAKA